MRRAVTFAAVVLAGCVRMSAQDVGRAAPIPLLRTIPRRSESAGPAATRRLLILPMPAFTEGAVRRAVDHAVRKLAEPECASVYEDFRLPEGQTPRSRLDTLGLGPEKLLETLIFVDGGRDVVCQTGAAGLVTNPGSRLIRVCPRFAEFQVKHPDMSGVLVIHESLHTLGLGENPPSSTEINQRVERRCWKTGEPRGEGRPARESVADNRRP